MRAKLSVAVLGVGLLLAAVPLVAHHSFAAEYDAQKAVKFTGTVTTMEWINPHAWIHIDVKKPDGKVESWMIEAGAPNALLRRGLPGGRLFHHARDEEDIVLGSAGWPQKGTRVGARLTFLLQRRKARRPGQGFSRACSSAS